jgi:hypothetical protein
VNTFTPLVSVGQVGGGIPVFTDVKCSVRAAIFDLNGNPLKNNALTVAEGGVPPSFQAVPSTVYFKHDNGMSIAVTSAGVHSMSTAAGSTLPNVALVPKGV